MDIDRLDRAALRQTRMLGTISIDGLAVHRHVGLITIFLGQELAIGRPAGS